MPVGIKETVIKHRQYLQTREKEIPIISNNILSQSNAGHIYLDFDAVRMIALTALDARDQPAFIINTIRTTTHTHILQQIRANIKLHQTTCVQYCTLPFSYFEIFRSFQL